MHQSEAFDFFKRNEEFFNQKRFLIYIKLNDLVTDIHCKIKVFADDTSIYITVELELKSLFTIIPDREKVKSYIRN